MGLIVLVIFGLYYMLQSSFCRLHHLECPSNHFILDQMSSCHRWLSCKDLNETQFVKPLGRGAVKNVFLGKWKEIPVVLSLPATWDYIEDFRSGVENLMVLNPSKYVVQFIGYCNDTNVLITEYHQLGNAARFFKEMKIRNFSISQSLEFCIQFSSILSFLHAYPVGPRVFCDSNDLEKLLSQLLVTSELALILNDVDALPVVVNSSGIKCGHRQLEGSFVAPEQLWAEEGEFREELMPGYDEKTDIWKAASVCDFFLKQSVAAEIVSYRLFDLHSRCKSGDPKLRPSAEELVKEYTLVMKEYSVHSEL